MINVEPKNLSISELHKYLLSGISPRPIALVSTISSSGINNLAPYSFFNCFSVNPPTVAFSIVRSGVEAETKDTYNNLIASRECVIQLVTFDIVTQVNVASAEYCSDVDEFIKSGLTPIESDLVKPKRVKESPFQMECVLRDMINLGEGRASSDLAICTVVKLHIAEDIFEDEKINPNKIDLVGRMGGNYYVRSSGAAIFELEQPRKKLGIGFDGIPNFIRESQLYSGFDLGRFASIEKIPDEIEILIFVKEYNEIYFSDFEGTVEAFSRYERVKDYKKMLKAILVIRRSKNHPNIKSLIERTAKIAIEINDILFAWKVALIMDVK